LLNGCLRNDDLSRFDWLFDRVGRLFDRGNGAAAVDDVFVSRHVIEGDFAV
jgi:hypothetical protein